MLFGNSKVPNELLDTFEIPNPESCRMLYPVIICDTLVFYSYTQTDVASPRFEYLPLVTVQ